MKLKVFHNMGLEQDRIQTAENSFRQVYQARYAPKIPSEDVQSQRQHIPRIPIEDLDDSMKNEFDNLIFGPRNDESSVNTSNITEIESYLMREPVEERSVDITHWWRINAKRFPTLALMARDYLSVPATRLVRPI